MRVTFIYYIFVYVAKSFPTGLGRTFEVKLVSAPCTHESTFTPNISVHILHTVLCKFIEVLKRRIYW